ncbi:hypothetical protein BG015_011408 [Linnemannia schmuckeri]|uniref:F-box domain-containing protein n=1 Tax=Linnemannia schmuckeri TaxID=64567 RepID=A0A9P5RUS3_9FUNG|nr:hypothetical protein BG015_011408 [Linnemannia schmuckeri]
MPAPTLPTEIVLTIARNLDRPSIFAALKVCRQWSVILGPFIWTSIRKMDWHHPSFPIEKCSISLDPTFNLCMNQLISLEWHNNASLIRTKATLYPRLQIRPSRLAYFLSMASKLTSLTLRMELHGPDPCLFDAIRGLSNLKTLDIDLPPTMNVLPIPIESMFPLFSRLEELHLQGSFYCCERDRRTPLPDEASWAIKSLTIDPIDTSLTRHCPRLTRLELLQPMFSMKRKKRLMQLQVTRLIQAPSSLKVLKLFSLTSYGMTYEFRVHHSGGKPSEPHLLPGQPRAIRWWSTQDVVALL